MVVLPRSPRLRVFVRLEESAGAHCPSLSPVSAPFLRNARHFLPSLTPPFFFCFSLSLSLSSLFLFFSPFHREPRSFSLSLSRPSFFVPFYFSFRVSSRRPAPATLSPAPSLCLFFIWVIWPRANTTFLRPPTHPPAVCSPRIVRHPFASRPTMPGKKIFFFLRNIRPPSCFRMRRNARTPPPSRYLTVLFRHALIDSLNVPRSVLGNSAWRRSSRISEEFKVSLFFFFYRSNENKGKEREFRHLSPESPRDRKRSALEVERSRTILVRRSERRKF